MYTMKESVAVAKEADAKKKVSPIKTDNSILRLRDEPERQLDSLRGVIGDIRRDGGTPSSESIATHLSGMHTGERAPALLALQQTHGNRYVQRVVSGIQAKLAVGQPGDIDEQEADRVAEQFISMPEQQVLQRPKEGANKENMQAKPHVQRNTSMAQGIIQIEMEGSQEPRDLDTIISKATGGAGNDIPYKKEMETFFGQDFSDVTAYSGKEAKEAAEQLGAVAFAVDKKVVFREDNSPDKQTVAHELTHVVQQRGSHTGHVSGKTSPSDRAEQEAGSVEQVISSGQQIPTISEDLPSSTVAGIFRLPHGEVVWFIDYDQRRERIVARISGIRGEGGETFEIPPEERERLSRQILPVDAVEVCLGLPPGSLITEEHNSQEGWIYFGILNPEENIPLLRTQIEAIEESRVEGGEFYAHYEYMPPELEEPTNNPDALAPASLEMLFRLYSTQQRRHRLMPTGIVFSRDWVMSHAGTDWLREIIRWKLSEGLGQPGQRQHLLNYVDNVQGSEPRKAELRAMINEAFDRIAEVGLEAAQHELSRTQISVEAAMLFIEPFEGRREVMYRDDRGNRTIGVGFNLERGDARRRIEAVGANFNDVINERQRLTDEQINELFWQDVETCIHHARSSVQNFDNLPESVKLIVVDMIFNMGPARFRGFRGTIAALEQEDFATAAGEMQDSRWFREQLGRRPSHHVNVMRRIAEQMGVSQSGE